MPVVEQTRSYFNCQFEQATFRRAVQTVVDGSKQTSFAALSISVGRDVFNVDDFDEWCGMYSEPFRSALLDVFVDTGTPEARRLRVTVDLASWGQTQVVVQAPSRGAAARVLANFDVDEPAARLPDPVTEPVSVVKPVVFIGHGRDPQWRDLKDHLADKHGIEVIAYETGARAGHTIRDVLQSMMTTASFAVLVMTAEDVQDNGDFRARQNVVHEAGLFQGKLGFDRAVVALEEGTELFSNLQGIDQIRFSPGKIQETYGDIVATIRREFEPG